MGIYGIILLAAVAQLTVGFPMLQAKMDSMVDGNPCIKQCLTRIIDSKMELNVAKTVDYGFYMQHLDEICELVAYSRQCIDQCGIASNPFAMKHMTVMCTPESMRTALAFMPCMKEKGAEVMNDCKKTCGPIDTINGELDALVEKIKKDQSDKESLKAALLKTNEGCGVTKCFARCSRQGFSNKCENVADIPAGEFLKAFIETALQATRADLEQMNLVQVMAANTPPECAYNYMPDLLFNTTADAETVKVLEQHLPELPESHQQSTPPTVPLPTAQEMLALQHEVLVRELMLLTKREQLLNKQALKLDLETAALQKTSMNFV